MSPYLKIMNGINQAVRKIRQSQYIIVAGHINPDGDSIGSLLSLGLCLKAMGKKVDMVSADGVPTMYRSLPGADQIIQTTNKIADLAIAVDCGRKELLGAAFTAFKRAKCILEIDHHAFRRPFGHIRLVNRKAAAVGELVYLLINKLGVRINPDIAQNILTSIIVETNSFRLPNVGPQTFQICAQLLKTGLDFLKLSEMVYWSRSKEASILTGICLSRSQFLKKGKLIWSLLKRSDLDKLNAKEEDADSIANEMLAIKGVEIVIFFRQVESGSLRVGLRAKGKINVARLARDYGGGGHFDAAGCIIADHKKMRDQFLKAAENLILRRNPRAFPPKADPPLAEARGMNALLRFLL